MTRPDLPRGQDYSRLRPAIEEDSAQWWEVEEALHDYWFAQESMTAGDAVRKLLAENKALREAGEPLAAFVEDRGASNEDYANVRRWREVAS